jgi:DNA polymerase
MTECAALDTTERFDRATTSIQSDRESRVVFLDIETRGTIDLRASGVHKYANHTNTEVSLVGFAIGDDPVQHWFGPVRRQRPADPVPPEIVAAALNPGCLFVAHNAQFDYVLYEARLVRHHGWPEVPPTRWRCTMAMAQASALPGSLEGGAAALGLPIRKDREGQRLMLAMARPQKPRKSKSSNIPFSQYIDDDASFARLASYNTIDEELLRAMFSRLRPLSVDEQALWQLDLVINARGFHVDVELAKAAHELVRREQATIDAEIAALTGGEITSAGQVARITEFVRERGHRLAGLTKRSVAAVLARGHLDEEVRRLLELRREGARASVQKLNALLAGVDADGRLRGTLRYHGAATGRWAGRGFQPHNLKRAETEDVTGAVDAVLAGDLDGVRKLGSPLSIVGDVMRSMICAAPGHVLMSGDFSTVEARILAWLAGEIWKLNIFRQYDVTGDPALDFYLVAASQALRRPVAPDDEAGRQVGKTCELAFGFGGAVGAWRKFDSDGHTDQEVNGFVQHWRQSHPATTRFWRRLESAVKRTVCTGERGALGNLAFELEHGTLCVVLPSGRRICYPEVRLVPGKFTGTTQVTFKDNARGGWSEARSWHGTFTENVVQGIARDLLVAAMWRIERAGYPIVLHVHDELVAEVPQGVGSVNEFHRLVVEPPAWAAGLPIAAKVRTGQRYSKSKSKTPVIEQVPVTADVVVDDEKVYHDDF